MRMRSLLFVPGDSGRKFARGCESEADVLILDLEDAVAPAMKDEARALVAGWIDRAGEARPALFVRINPLDSGLALADLAAVVRPGLSAVVLPKAEGSADVVRLGHYLDAFEQTAGMEPGSVKILVVATETPAAMFALGSYREAGGRLIGLAWGAEDLGAAIGMTANREDDGGWTFPCQVARAQCLFAAAAAEVAPIETIHADFRDMDGLEASCREARRDGFTGRLAIHPAQVEVINRCFSPSEQDVAQARRLVEAFAANPDAGALAIDGRMYDIPHLKAARKILAAVGED